MGNCGTCCGKTDINELSTEKGLGMKTHKGAGVRDHESDDLKKGSKNMETTKTNASFQHTKTKGEHDHANHNNDKFCTHDFEINDERYNNAKVMVSLYQTFLA